VLKWVFLGLLLAGLGAMLTLNSFRREAPRAPSVTANTTPWIRFTFTAVELRDLAGARWLAIDYVDDVHGDCQKAFPWETTVPGFKAETRTTQFVKEDKDSPAVRHQRIEYRMPDSAPREQLDKLREDVEQALKQKSVRLESEESPFLLFELPRAEGGSLKAWVKVVPPLNLDESPAQGAMTFGPAVMRTLSFNESMQDGFLDLDTGRLLTPPKDIAALFQTAYLTRLEWERKSDPRAVKMREWLQANGADFMACGGEHREGLEMREVVALAPTVVSNGVAVPFGFEQADANYLATRINRMLESAEKQREGSKTIWLLQPGFDPRLNTRQDSFCFRTRKGTVGILQILNTVDNPPGLQIRYKLLQEVEAVPPLKLSPSQSAKTDEAAEIRIQLARDQLAVARERVAVGKATPMEVVEAEHKLAVAEARGDAVTVARANLQLAEATLAGARKRYEAGHIPQSELRSAEGQRAIAEIELKEALKNPGVPSAALNTTNTAASAELWSPKIDPGEKPNLNDMLQEARSLAQDGRYEEALQRHLWYHNHALEFEPSQSGVRLSFALSSWTELARRYPKAKAALVEIRDRGEREFAGGGGYFDLFSEISAINGYLGQKDATLALFKSIQSRNFQLARQCYRSAEDLLVEAGDYALCARFVPDFQKRFETIRATRERMLELADSAPAVNQTSLRKHAERTFVKDARQLVEILVGTGRKMDAEKIRDKAVAVLSVPELQSAVTDAEQKVVSRSAPAR